MQCAISYKKSAKNKTCQFNVTETEFTKFDNRYWCLFHLPMVDAENNFSIKSNWQAKELKYFKKKIKNLLLNNFGDFKFVVFPKDFILPLNNYSIALFFKHAEFWGDANFGNKFFCKRVRFDNVTFFGNALFSKSSFKKVKFIKSNFKKKSHFFKTTFERGVDFSFSKFGDDSSFRDSTIKCKEKWDGIYFDNVKFKKDVTFRDTSFYSDVSFRNSSFYSSANFSISNQ